MEKGCLRVSRPPLIFLGAIKMIVVVGILMLLESSIAWTVARQGPRFITALNVQYRGLETKREGATPMEGGMTLYMKAAADGVSVGDCPFAHFVRMVLEEKNLEYQVQPAVQETKPQWLIDHYEGKMPALRHRKECYVESDVIAEYLDFFFPNPELKADKESMKKAENAIEGFFPAFAKYTKHTPDDDEEDEALKEGLKEKLDNLEKHLSETGGPFLAGDKLTLLDCSLTPKLYHMKTTLEAFKSNAINVDTEYPKVAAYMNTMFTRESFQKTVYPKDVVTWGWGNARS